MKVFDNFPALSSQRAGSMQIHRYDNDSHGYTPPKISARAAGEQGVVGNVPSSSSTGNASGLKTETTDSRMATLVGRLQAVPRIRSSAVEAAREKLTRGEFTTPEAARQLAATNLRNDIF